MASRNVLVSGRTGQVASALAESSAASEMGFAILGRSEMSILSRSQMRAAFDRVRPSLVINAAAFTDVDSAETAEVDAVALNAEAAAGLAEMAAEFDAPILHLSTDYVFDGTKTEAYLETDPVAPLGVYGRSKLLGEQLVAAAQPEHLILRTAWVYGRFGKNFVKTMLRVADGRDDLNVVDDQCGNPTSAHDIANALIRLADKYFEPDSRWAPGTYHMAGEGDATWADLATFIFKVSGECDGPTARVKRISSAEWPTPVTRPTNSRLNCGKLEQAFGIKLPHWKTSTRACVEQLIKTRTWG